MKQLVLFTLFAVALSCRSEAAGPESFCQVILIDVCPTSGPFSYNCSHQKVYKIVCNISKTAETPSEAAQIKKEMEENLSARWGY